MKVKWSEEAKADTVRLHAFLAAVNKRAAAVNASALIAASRKLGEYPRIGQRLDRFSSREVRRILVGNYEMRYEITETTILILRVWHAREDR